MGVLDAGELMSDRPGVADHPTEAPRRVAVAHPPGVVPIKIVNAHAPGTTAGDGSFVIGHGSNSTRASAGVIRGGAVEVAVGRTPAMPASDQEMGRAAGEFDRRRGSVRTMRGQGRQCNFPRVLPIM